MHTAPETHIARVTGTIPTGEGNSVAIEAAIKIGGELTGLVIVIMPELAP